MYLKKIIVLVFVCFGVAAFLLGHFLQIKDGHNRPYYIFYDSIPEIEKSIYNRSGKLPFDKQELRTSDAHYLLYSTDSVRGTAFYCICCFEQADPHDPEPSRWLLRGYFSVNALTFTNGTYWLAKPIYEVDGNNIKIKVYN